MTALSRRAKGFHVFPVSLNVIINTEAFALHYLLLCGNLLHHAIFHMPSVSFL
jgi:hypothetical protein